MNRKKISVISLAAALLVVVLGGSSGGAWSQEPLDPDTDSNTEAAATQAPVQGDRPDQPGTDPIDEKSPFDYQASEEISQDLSVSFPVDI